MGLISDGLQRTEGPVQAVLDGVRQEVGENNSLLKRALRLAKQAVRDFVCGNRKAVSDARAELSQILKKLKVKMGVGWLREQTVERVSSVLMRLVFVEKCFLFVKGEEESTPTFPLWGELSISVQAWLWGLAQGPRELAEAVLLLRSAEDLSVEDHIAVLRRFLEIAEVAETFLADIGKYPQDVMSISGDRRRSIPEELRKLREEVIAEHRKELVQLLAFTAPDAPAD